MRWGSWQSRCSATIFSDTVAVNDGSIAICILQIAGGVVDAVRPGERVQQVDALGVALLELGLQGVVLQEAGRNGGEDVGEG
jgi:hypothetical protein